MDLVQYLLLGAAFAEIVASLWLVLSTERKVRILAIQREQLARHSFAAHLVPPTPPPDESTTKNG